MKAYGFRDDDKIIKLYKAGEWGRTDDKLSDLQLDHPLEHHDPNVDQVSVPQVLHVHLAGRRLSGFLLLNLNPREPKGTPPC